MYDAELAHTNEHPIRAKKTAPVKELPLPTQIAALLLDIIAFVEALDTTCSINKLLLSCEERMASRANFNVDIFYR